MDQGFQPYTKAERLLNLLMALRGTRVGLDRDQIRTQVRGYRPDATPEAFERMFERDKDELRALGIPIRTLTDGAGVVTGYRIDPDWTLPPLDLDRAELAMLSLAARVWHSAELAPAAINALRKVEAALGVAPGGPPTSVPFAGMSADSPELLALIDACTRRQAVSFAYRKRVGDRGDDRLVQPWGVVWWRAHWYLVGWDIDRGDVRVFRASRITGAVRAAGPEGAFQVPAGFDAREAIGRFGTTGDVALRIRLAPGRGAALRRDGRALDGSSDTIEVAAADVVTGVAAALGAGVAAVVEDPQEAVREAVRQLDAILAAHARTPAPAGRAIPIRSGSAPAQAQFARLLALVPWLAANSGVTISEAAAHFGITEDQLLADLSSVITSGADDWTLFDIQYWENGGVIDVIDALDLQRPLTLAPDEAFSLLVALHAMEAMPGGHDRELLERVLSKVRALLGDRAPAAGAVAVRVDVPGEVLEPIERALAQGRALELVYLGAVRDEVTERVVDPIAVVVVDGHSYLRAHCRSAGDLRLFRLDRILSAVTSEEPAQPVPDASGGSVEPMAVTLASTGRSVIIDVPSDSPVLDRHPVTRSWALEDRWVRAEVPVGDHAWARGLVLGSAGDVVLREPDWLVEQVLAAASRARAAHAEQMLAHERLQ